MKTVDAILLMAGASTRFASNIKKPFYEINHKPLFLYSLDVLINHPSINHIYIVYALEDFALLEDIISANYDTNQISLVEGGLTRLESVQNALKLVDSDVVIIHDAARPLIQKVDLDNLLSSSLTFSCGSMYHDIYDTIKMVDTSITTIDRNKLKAVSTPQFFVKKLYQKILEMDPKTPITDEIMLFEKDYMVAFVKESRPNLKVTTQDDLKIVEYYLDSNKVYKIGHSLDFHPFKKAEALILGGVKIPYIYGLKGHSDADALYHAITEAIIGALGLGDIGTWFPDNDDKYLKKASSYFVKEAVQKAQSLGYIVVNIDTIIYIQKPSLKPYKTQMAQNIKALTNCSYVNVKATTMEKKGVIGNSEGIACEAVVLMQKLINNK